VRSSEAPETALGPSAAGRMSLGRGGRSMRQEQTQEVGAWEIA